MRTAGGHAAGADLIRRANALTALRCYWDPTHRLGACGAVLMAVPRDGGPVVAALSARGLRWRLVACRGYVPSLRLGAESRP